MSQTPDTAAPPVSPARAALRSVLTAAVLLGLYLGGVGHWVLFFNGGDLALNAYDWGKEHAAFRVLREAVASGRVPYHAPNVFHPQRTFHGTDRFLGLPETNLWPQVLLLPHLDLGPFVLADTLLFYSLSFAGCLLLRRRYRLGLVAFALLFLLFHFNGYITAHLSAGHSMWNGYFLLPFFCLGVLRWLEEGASARLVVGLALVLFGMMLRGSFHLVLWCWMFLLLFVLFNPRQWRPGLAVLAWSGLFCFFRLLPAAVAFWGSREYPFMGGYPTATDLLEAFVVLRGPDHPVTSGMGWWEFDAYVGLLGFAAVVYLGIALRFRDAPDLAPHRYPALDVPLLVLAFLSLSRLYAPIPLLPLPLANAERVSSRLIIVPVVFLIVLAAVRLQRLLERARPSTALAVLLLGGLAETAFTLGQHSYEWRVARSEGEWPPLPDVPVELTARSDPWYVGSIQVSAAVSAAALLAGLYVLLRPRTAAKPFIPKAS